MSLSISDVIEHCESQSEAEDFVEEILHEVVPSEASSENFVTKVGENGNFYEALDAQNVVVNRLKNELKQAYRKRGPGEDAVITQIRKEYAKEVHRLEHLVDHIVKHNRVLHVQESFDLEQGISDENVGLSVGEVHSEASSQVGAVGYKDRMLDSLKEKVENLQEKMSEAPKKRPKVPKKHSKFSVEKSGLHHRQMAKELGKREKDLNMMELGMNRMDKSLRNMRDTCCSGYKATSKRPQRAFEEKSNYSSVVRTLAKKNAQVRDLSMQLRCKAIEDRPATEIAFLHEMNHKLNEKNFTLETIVKEQSNQLKMYQEKYINAQQIANERHGLMRRMEQKANQMEESIHCEMERVRKDFQRKMQEMQQKLDKVTGQKERLEVECRKRRNLQNDLDTVIPELERLQRQEDVRKREKKQNLSVVITELQEEIQCLTYKCNKISCERDDAQDNFAKVEGELEKNRMEMVEIIKNTKIAHEEINKTLRQQIEELEGDLSQCRACAKLALDDREKKIEYLKKQISILESQITYNKPQQFSNIEGNIKEIGRNEIFCIKCNCD